MRIRDLFLLVLVLLGVGAWEVLGFTYYTRAHQEEHRRLGNLLLSSVEGILHLASRRGMYSPSETAQVLEEKGKRLGILFVGLRDEKGNWLVKAGKEGLPGEEGVSFTRVTRSFQPKKPQSGLGQGPPRRPPWAPSWEGWKEFPPGPLTLVLEYPRKELEAHLAWGLRKTLLESAGIVLALVFFFLFHAGRVGAARLEAQIQARDERIRSMTFLGRLAAGLVHETKNPLASIRGLATLLSSGDLEGQEAKAALARLVEEADRAVARLDEFLLVSRPSELRLEETDLKSLLEELVEIVEPEIQGKGASLRLSGPSLRVQADPEQARRLFLNLLLNAAAFVPEGGNVRVRLEKTGEGGRVVVEDDGPGVPKEIEETLFEPYVSRRPGGSGLGLAISKRIALEHGWDLRHERPAGGGARMVVECRNADEGPRV